MKLSLSGNRWKQSLVPPPRGAKHYSPSGIRNMRRISRDNWSLPMKRERAKSHGIKQPHFSPLFRCLGAAAVSIGDWKVVGRFRRYPRPIFLGPCYFLGCFIPSPCHRLQPPLLISRLFRTLDFVGERAHLQSAFVTGSARGRSRSRTYHNVWFAFLYRASCPRFWNGVIIVIFIANENNLSNWHICLVWTILKDYH